MLNRVIEVRVVSPEAIESIDWLTMMRHHYQPRLKIDRPLLSINLFLLIKRGGVQLFFSNDFFDWHSRSAQRKTCIFKDSVLLRKTSCGLSHLRHSILVLCAHGLFHTDHVKPTLWQRLVTLWITYYISHEMHTQNPCQYKEQLMNHGGILILFDYHYNCKYFKDVHQTTRANI